MTNIRFGRKTENIFSVLIRLVDRFSWLILLISTPLFLFLSKEISWILLLIPFLWGVSFFSGSKPIPITPYNPLLLILSFQILISLYATYDIAVSLPKISGLLFSLALFFSLIKINHQKSGVLTTVVVLMSCGLGIGILGLIGTDWSTNKIQIFNPVYDQISFITQKFPGLISGFHPNEVAGALLWVIPIWLALFAWIILGEKRLRKNLGSFFYWVIIILILLFIFFLSMVFIFTQSRSAYIGFALSLVITFLFILSKRMKLIFSGLIAIGVISLFLLIFNGRFIDLVNFLFPGSGLATTAFSINTLSGRIEIWSRAIYAIQDFSFTGMGLNTFRNIVHVLYPLYTVSPDIPIKDIGHAHNEFLQVGLDLGIPGLIAFIGINISSFWMLVASILRQKKNYHHAKGKAARLNLQFWYCISTGIFAGLTAHFIFGLTDAISLGAKPGIIYWIMLSLVCSIYFKTHSPNYTARSSN